MLNSGPPFCKIYGVPPSDELWFRINPTAEGHGCDSRRQCLASCTIDHLWLNSPRQARTRWVRNVMASAMPSLALPYLSWHGWCRVRGCRCSLPLSGPESSYVARRSLEAVSVACPSEPKVYQMESDLLVFVSEGRSKQHGGRATPQDVAKIVGGFASEAVGDQHVLRRVQHLG